MSAPVRAATPLRPDIGPFPAHVVPGGAAIVGGVLTVAGVPLGDIASAVGTPAYVYEQRHLEARLAEAQAAFAGHTVAYAAKAFCCVAMCELAAAAGVVLDVVSDGELATALAAGFPPARILFHGNNKTPAELAAARRAGVGRIVVDSPHDVDRLAALCAAGPPQTVLLRVTPGVEPFTHEYVTTGSEQSKFGVPVSTGQARAVAERILDTHGLVLSGLHLHIGSQITDLDAWRDAARIAVRLLADLRDTIGITFPELNMGGGLATAYVAGDRPPSLPQWAGALLGEIADSCAAAGLDAPRVLVEPGRAITANAGLTLYTVGVVKQPPGGPLYVAVDGGMSDNIRTALYRTAYVAGLANRPRDPHDTPARVVGKHCEEGDVVVWDTRLPADVAPGDLLAVAATGAYCFSMASNYNRVGRPPVVFVKDGAWRVVVDREPAAATHRFDRHLDGRQL